MAMKKEFLILEIFRIDRGYKQASLYGFEVIIFFLGIIYILGHHHLFSFGS